MKGHKINMEKKKEDSLGHKILQALTQDQVVELLNEIFSSQNNEEIASLLENLDPDISSTLDLYLNPKKTSKKPKRKVVSNEKLMEEWRDLWGDWEEIIFNAGNEKGEYVHQDYHWEEPYFSHDDVVEDLENIAKKMWPLVDKVHSLEICEDNEFEDALKDVSSSIQDLPEWLGADYERCMVGPVTTKCILQWDWLTAEAHKNSAVSFVKRIIEFDSELGLFYLNDEAIVEFFLSLPDKARKEIYDDITGKKNARFWQPHLSSSLSKWYRIYHGLSQFYAPEQFLENCRNSIDEDWEYGLPLLEHLIKLKDYAEAEKIVRQTCSSYLDYRADKPWQPEQSLFIEFFLNYHAISDKKPLSLLSYWKSIAKGLGQKERGAALNLQIIICKKLFRWDDVVNAFKDVRSLSYKDLASRLFHQWKLYILKRNIQRSMREDTEAETTWIYWLLETGWDDTKNKIWFEKQVLQWLEFLLENPEQFKRQRDLIYILSNDLAQEESPLKKNYPKLFKYVLNYYRYGELTKNSRIAWLKRMNGEKFLPLLMQCWKKNIGCLVPDPSNAHKSRYHDHAHWMAVVKELNSSIYTNMINQWKIDHHRRKNLWAALKEMDLPF